MRVGLFLQLSAFCVGFFLASSRGAEKPLLPAVDDRWRHVRSPNFEIYSHNGETEARQLLEHLELLRAVFLERFKVVERARVDVTVYYFRTKADFHAYATERIAQHGGFAGFYQQGADRAIISVGPIADWGDAQALIFHEYVHHLFRVVELEPAAWFNEGMAELLASIRVVGKTVEIGHPHLGRIVALREGRLLPLEKLFSTTHDSDVFKTNEHTGMFYAESWALLHYWYFGESGLAKDALTRFTQVAGERKFSSPEGLRAFFQKCLGMDYPEMQRRLETYVESGRYRFGRQPLPTLPPAKSYGARAVPRNEILVRLAELALRVRREPAAKVALLGALAQAQAAGKPPDPRVLEMLGVEALADGDPMRAGERWEEALAAGSKNPAIVRELGLLEGRTWFERFDPDFRLPAATAARIRGRLLRAIEHEPEQAAAYEMLAWVEAFAETPDIGNLNRVQGRFNSLRQQARTVLALAFVRLRTKVTPEALKLLDAVDELEPDSWTMHAAQVLRTAFAVRASTVAKVEEARAASLPEAEIIRPRVRVPSVELPEKYSGK